MPISDGERLIIHMLCDLYEKLGKKWDIDPKFVRSALNTGHTWGLARKYPYIFYDTSYHDHFVVEVDEILAMWSTLQESFDRLSPDDVSRVKAKIPAWASSMKFPGFDGQHEAQHLSITLFLINNVGQWQNIDKKNLNSGKPMRYEYRRIRDNYDDLLRRLACRGIDTSGGIGASEIIHIFTGDSIDITPPAPAPAPP